MPITFGSRPSSAVAGRDGAGNVGAGPTAPAVTADALPGGTSAARYSGSWSTDAIQHAPATASCAVDAGRRMGRVQASPPGRSRSSAPAGPDQGKAKVYVDGVLRGDDRPLPRRPVAVAGSCCSADLATPGLHTVKLSCRGRRSRPRRRQSTRSRVAALGQRPAGTRNCRAVRVSCPGTSSSSTAPAAAARGSCARCR